MLERTSAAIASDSFDSIVVWLATPTRSRSRSGSNPGELLEAKSSTNRSRLPAPSMYSHTTRASPMSRTTTYLPPGYLFTWLRSEDHTSELQSQFHLVCHLLLEKKI